VLAMAACLLLVVPAWFTRGDWSTIRSSFALGLPIALGALSMFVMNSGDRLVIQSLLGPAETGRYQIAYTIGFEAITVFAYTAKAWAARFAEVRDDARRWRLLGQSRDHLYELLAPTLLAVNLGAPLALRILAPESFRPEGLLVVVLLVSLSGVPNIAGLASTRALIVQRRTRPIAVAAGVGAGANLGLNLLLVPVWGLEGAAAATAVAFTIEAVILRAAFRPYRAWPRTPPRVVALLVGTTAVSAVFAFVDQSPAWIAIRTVLAASCGGWLVLTYLRGRRAHTAPEPPALRVPAEDGGAPPGGHPLAPEGARPAS
jgi:O-antigen/teichoic acid export membrane protein